MTHCEFIVPDEDNMLDTLGVETEAVEGENDTVRRLRFAGGNDEELVVTFDVLQRSVSMRWSIGGTERVEIYREGVVLMRPEWEDGVGRFFVDFSTDELTGTLTAQIHPTFVLNDSMLFT